MTAPNEEGVVRVIRGALRDACTDPAEVDVINGHLTATRADTGEIRAWCTALGRRLSEMPVITATKSLFGHALSAAGAIESVASVIMVRDGFAHACLNSDDLHPELADLRDSVPLRTLERRDLRTLVKAGFGFGDVNACVVLRRYAD